MKIIYKLGGGKFLYFATLSLLCVPHVFVYLVCRNKHIIQHDVNRWIDCTVKEHHGHVLDLLYLLSFCKEFRNVFYLRAGFARFFMQWYLRPLATLYINVPSARFGEGTFIQHGFATVITAESIGKDCWINQQVTIGFNDSRKYGYGKPIIGNNVRISAGAKVCGKVTVGDNSTIGVNAVVVKNVPSNSVVIPSPTMMIVEDNKQIYKKL